MLRAAAESRDGRHTRSRPVALRTTDV